MTDRFKLASAHDHAAVADLAAELGFTDVRIVDRGTHLDPLIHARWNGAPVALSLRSGLVGGFSCAFYRGEQPVTIDEDGIEIPGNTWDEVIDTQFGDAEVALVLGAAALQRFAHGRETAYAHVASPSLATLEAGDEPDDAAAEALE